MKAIDLLPYWADNRALLVESLGVLRDDDLVVRPAPGLPSIGDVLRHLVTTEEYWWRGGILGEPWEAWRPAGWTALDVEQKHAYRRDRFPTLDAIREGLASVHAPVDAFLQALDADRLCEKRQATWGESNTLRWIMWHLVEHDQHHRAQLFTRLRLLGHRPPAMFPRRGVMASTPAARWTDSVDVAQVVPYWKPLYVTLRDAVAPLAPGELAYRPAEGYASIGDLVLHAVAGVYEAFGQTLTPGAALASAVDGAHEVTQNFIRALRVRDLARVQRTPWGPQTLHHALWYAREHVVHHRAQVFFRMRMMGRTPPEI
jgi:uncharacterized damage-inducible protein DinB